MVVDVCDPGWVVQVGVEELQVLAQTVSGRHSSTQTVVTVLDGPAGSFAVDPDQESWKCTRRHKRILASGAKFFKDKPPVATAV